MRAVKLTCVFAINVLPPLLVLATTGLGSHPAADDRPYVAPKGYVCFRASARGVSDGAITIDGKINEPAWSAAPWTDPFVDIEGDAKPTPRFRTQAKMLWDDKYFYVAARLEEPHVQASYTEHDSPIFHEDNDFEVFIDPDGDSHNYVEFEMNALNTGWDLRLTKPYKNGGRAENDWEIPGLKTAVFINGTLNDPSDTDGGWTIELAFPLEVIGQLSGQTAPPQDGARWRVNFSRVEWRFDTVAGKYQRVRGRPEDNWVWSPQWVINMHRPETWGYVQFSNVLSESPDAALVRYEPDPAGPAKHVLHRVQYAQDAFRKEHNRWAKTLDELGAAAWTDRSLAKPLVMTTNDAGYQISAVVRLPSGSSETWHIREDARIWRE
jgi:hypothetical protein